MDKRIIWLALVILLIVGAIIGYRYYSKGKKKAVANHALISVDTKEIFAGGTITYIDNTPSADVKIRQWDFGDHSPFSDSVQGTHQYLDSGTYLIKLTINNSYSDSAWITVTPVGEKQQGPKLVLQGPKLPVYVGEPATFTDPTPEAEHTRWHNGATGENKTGKTYTTIFPVKGDFDVTAYNEKNTSSNGQGVLHVHVIAKEVKEFVAPIIPPKPSGGTAITPTRTTTPSRPPDGGGSDPKKPLVRSTNDEQILTYFREIATNKTLSTTYPKILQAIGNDEAISVVSKLGEKKIRSFCIDLKAMNPTVKSVSIVWDDNTNTITKINATISDK